MIPRRPAKDGKYGPLTTEALFLFSKSDEYVAGYRLGKVTGNEGQIKERETYATLRGDGYLQGFKDGQRVFKYGIKKGLRSANHDVTSHDRRAIACRTRTAGINPADTQRHGHRPATSPKGHAAKWQN